MAFEGFVFPVPAIGSRIPVVSDGFHQRDTEFHYGADIDFKRLDNEPIGLPYGTKGYFTPPGTLALAAGPGVVAISKDITTGGYIQIDHGSGIKTQYMHLAPRQVGVGETVSAGQVIGTVGHDIRPTANKFDHLHFEILINGTKVNPEDYIYSWSYIQAPSSDMTKWLLVGGVAILVYLYVS